MLGDVGTGTTLHSPYSESMRSRRLLYFIFLTIFRKG